jgi:hypothetical protein
MCWSLAFRSLEEAVKVDERTVVVQLAEVVGRVCSSGIWSDKPGFSRRILEGSTNRLGEALVIKFASALSARWQTPPLRPHD